MPKRRVKHQLNMRDFCEKALWERFKELCRQEGQTAKGRLKKLVEADLEQSEA